MFSMLVALVVLCAIVSTFACVGTYIMCVSARKSIRIMRVVRALEQRLFSAYLAYFAPALNAECVALDAQAALYDEQRTIQYDIRFADE
jgi:hypothetical protein